MRFYRYLKPGMWAMRLPMIGPWIQKIAIPEDEDANWFIPVGEAIPRGYTYILPETLVTELLHAAAGIFVMKACPCRVAFGCQNHPQTLGCLHLGPAAGQIPADVGRILSLEEGLTHLEQTLSSGLMPTILHMPSEADIFKVERTSMLSICFCCECCCDVRLLLRQGPDRYWDSYNHRLPGLTMQVSEACTRCGECVQACYGGERVIQVGADRAQIDESCIGCGRCVPACPEGAISIICDPTVDVVQSLLARISDRVQIGI
jgi:UDP-glucose 4-epimerase